MSKELELRVWRLDGISEFLKFAHFAHPTSDAFHQSLALCFVDEGAFNLRHCGVRYAVGRGMLLVAQSGEITSREPLSGTSNHREFHCSPGALETIADEMEIRLAGGRLFQSPFICDESLIGPFLRFHAAMASRPTMLESSSRLREFVGELIVRYGIGPAARLRLGNERRGVRRVKECLESRYAEHLTLDELSRIANLSPFHLVRVFRKEVGLPPHAYQTRLRLNHGKALLAHAATLREAALSAGFFDQSPL